MTCFLNKWCAEKRSSSFFAFSSWRLRFDQPFSNAWRSFFTNHFFITSLRSTSYPDREWGMRIWGITIKLFLRRAFSQPWSSVLMWPFMHKWCPLRQQILMSWKVHLLIKEVVTPSLPFSSWVGIAIEICHKVDRGFVVVFTIQAWNKVTRRVQKHCK